MTVRRACALISATALAAVLLPTGVATAAPDQHSSDGVRGPLLGDVSPARRGPVEPPAAWQVGPGVGYREWTATLRQGGVRMHLLEVDLATPGVSLDLAAGEHVTDRARLTRLLADRDATVGVNADFFDIDDTGAPLGVGRERARGLLQGPRRGWNSCFRVDADGRARIGTTRVVGAVRRSGARPLTVHALNSPVLRAGEIGLYTPTWGDRPGRRVLEDPRQDARQVGVVDGVVRWTTTRPRAAGPVRGQVLLGTGRGAEALASLEVGQRVRVSTRSSAAAARVVACGSTRLVRGDELQPVDARELHPRTAVGVDHDRRRVLLLVADGRSESSSGLTLRQTAHLLHRLGADEALNLDGGGSSTMVAPDATGRVGVRNHPSDGRQRPVPNGLLVRYPRS